MQGVYYVYINIIIIIALWKFTIQSNKLVYGNEIREASFSMKIQFLQLFEDKNIRVDIAAGRQKDRNQGFNRGRGGDRGGMYS